MLARIVSGAPGVYWDIQAGNPVAPAARAGLQRGIERIAGVADSADEAGFAALIDELRLCLGSNRAELTEICAQMFDRLPAALGRRGDISG
jgi:prephenate dehydrogenase